MSLDSIARRRLPSRPPNLLAAVLLRGQSMRLLEGALAGLALATALLLGLAR